MRDAAQSDNLGGTIRAVMLLREWGEDTRFAHARLLAAARQPYYLWPTPIGVLAKVSPLDARRQAEKKMAQFVEYREMGKVKEFDHTLRDLLALGTHAAYAVPVLADFLRETIDDPRWHKPNRDRFGRRSPSAGSWPPQYTVVNQGQNIPRAFFTEDKAELEWRLHSFVCLLIPNAGKMGPLSHGVYSKK